MTDPFRQFFLESVQTTMNDPPSARSLHALLKFAIPSLTMQQLQRMVESHGHSDNHSHSMSSHNKNQGELSKCLKMLKSRIHPDRHPGNGTMHATQLFQNVSLYFDQCLEVMMNDSDGNGCESDGSCDSGSDNDEVDVPSNHAKQTSSSNKRHRKRASSSSKKESKVSKKKNKNGFSKQKEYQKRRDEEFPTDYCVYDQWPDVQKVTQTSSSIHASSSKQNRKQPPQNHIHQNHVHHPLCPPSNQNITKQTLPIYQAYKCLHARGTIAHGKPITKYYTWDDVLEQTKKSKTKGPRNDDDENTSARGIYKVFDDMSDGGGTKELETIQDIKRELMTYGPVISVSFRLLPAYRKHLTSALSTMKEEHAFVKQDKEEGEGGNSHELLIVGWGLTPYGEAWKVQPLIDDDHHPSSHIDPNHPKNVSCPPPIKSASAATPPSLIYIGLGQFGIDDLCLAPNSTLEHVEWEHGPYFTSDFSECTHDDWRTWKEMDIPLIESEMRGLACCFGTKGLFCNDPFVIRDAVKKAHSGRYTIKNLRWEDSTEEWVVTVVSYSSSSSSS